VTAEPIHHADFTIEACALSLRLNGYLLVQAGARQRYNTAPPVNFWLVGKGNVLEATLEALETPATNLKQAEMVGSVRAYAEDEFAGDGIGGQPIVEMSIPPDMKEQAERDELDLPITLTATFDNDGPDFTARLVNAQPITDRDALLDYGMKLRDLFAAGDADAIMDEQAPLVADHAAAYYHPAPQEAAFRDHLVGNLLGNDPDTSFERDDLELAAHCGNRIWEIRRRGGAELIETKPTDVGAYVVRILVGLVDGKLKIVR
jgi:hypothetical protein